MTTHATLETATLEVMPGGESTCRLILRNTSDVVEAYQLDVVGDAARWSHVDPAAVSLYPNAETIVNVVFQPPRSALAPAGEVPFAVRVIPAERPDQAVAPEGMVVVQPFAETTAEIMPRTSRGRRVARHEVAVDNRGNVPVTAALRGVDPDGQVTARIRPPALAIPPGQAAFSTIVVRSKRRLWRGSPVTHPFQVLVETPDEPPIALSGATLQTPIIPKGAGRLAALVAGAAVLVLAAWLLLLKPAVTSAAKEAVQKPLAQVAQQADEADRKADAAGSKAEAAGKPVEGAVATRPPVAPEVRTTAPVRVRLATALGASNTPGTDSFVVPAKTTMIITDVVLQNPQGDTGRVDVVVDGNAILTLALANFRDLDFHFVSPIQVPAGKSLTIRTTCQTPGTALPGTAGGAQCRVWMLASGTTEVAQV